VRGQRHALAALYPRERPGTHCTGGWVSHRTGLYRGGKFRPYRDLIPGPSSYTAIPTTLPGSHTDKGYVLKVTACKIRSWNWQVDCHKLYIIFTWVSRWAFMNYLFKRVFVLEYKSVITEIIPLMQSQVFTQLRIENIKNFFLMCASQINIILLTEEFAFDLGNFLRWGKPTFPFS